MAKVFNVPQVQSRLRLYDERSRAAMRAGLTAGAKRVQEYSKANHRWINRTGDAEKELVAFVVDGTRGGSTGFRISHQHGVPYGEYLEKHFQGRYAILMEAILKNWSTIITDCARRVKGVRG